MRPSSFAFRFVALSLACLAQAHCGGNGKDDAGDASVSVQGSEAGVPIGDGQETLLFKMESVQGVMRNPPVITTFTLAQTSYVTRVWTYHDSAVIGAKTPTVAFKNTSTGVLLGPWPQVGYRSFAGTLGATADHPGNIPGPPDNYWMAYPGATIPAGTYQVIDSSPETWSYTSDLGNRGVAWVYGYAGSGPPPRRDAGTGTDAGRLDLGALDGGRIDATTTDASIVGGTDSSPLDGGVDVASVSFTATIVPSTEGTTLTIAPGVSITIPGGLLTAATTLTVTPVAAPPAPIYPGLEIGAAYDIQLGDLHSFAQDLTLRFKYDPTRLRTDIPVERNLSAATWDTAQNIWVAMPSTVDQSTSEVVIKTNHLSMFSWLMKKVGYSVFFKNNFYLVYNKAAVTDPNFLVDYHNPDQSNYVDINTPNYIEDVMAFLIQAWTVYMGDQKFTPPPAPVDVFVGTNENNLADKFTGLVVISLAPKNPEQLKLVTAHELFHRVQNSYYSDLGGMITLTWWLEATADYAGDVMVWKGLNEMGGQGGIKRTYLQQPLADTSEEHNEGYATAHFVKYLVDQGADFKTMFTTTAASNPLFFTSALDAYLQEALGANNGLATQYRGFARYFIFDKRSPMPITDDSIYAGTDGYKTTVATTAKSQPMLLEGGYACALWSIKVADSVFDAAHPKASFTIDAGDAASSTTLFDVFVLKGDKRLVGGSTPVGTITPTQKTVTVEVEKGDAIYVQGIRWSTLGGLITLTISPVTTPQPSDCHFVEDSPTSVTLTLASTTCNKSNTLSFCFTPGAGGSIAKSGEAGCEDFLDSYEVSGTYGCNAVNLTYSFAESASATYAGCSSSAQVTRTFTYSGSTSLTWSPTSSTFAVGAGTGTITSKYSSRTCTASFPTCSGTDLQISAAK